MPRSPLGRTLLIANPTAHSGAGGQAADFAESFLTSYGSATRGFEVRRTQAAGDATKMSAGAAGFDTVVALGGDGVIHEVVGGLMRIPGEARPQLGIVPIGTGNDYARTLGMARNDPERALAQLVRGRVQPTDLGEVNGIPFMETLSFGLDAAIALDTTDRRSAGTSMEGEGLFLSSGVRIMSQARRGWSWHGTIDGRTVGSSCSVVFAIQVGPTYGGGFRVCPKASPTDGRLDVCYNTALPAVPRVLGIFGLARFGLHTSSRVLQFATMREATLDFEEEPPAQADGERVTGAHFEVRVLPAALRVLVP